jgi:precorrin-8X/cobalt-precorrin-8 methylmutase
MLPEEIERESFRIIDSLAGQHDFNENEWKIVQRIIHSTADFDFIKTVKIHPFAIESGINAIKNGCEIIFDTKMALNGASKKNIQRFCNKSHCFIDDEDVIYHAKNRGQTRSAVAMEKAVNFLEDAIAVIGNAPTALFSLIELIKENRVKPALIIGVPVGFVGARESKEALMTIDTPYITAIGNKGGTPVAVSALNALFNIALILNNIS